MGFWTLGDTFFFHELGKNEPIYEFTVEDRPVAETAHQAIPPRVISPEHAIGKALLSSCPGLIFSCQTSSGDSRLFILAKVIHDGRLLDMQSDEDVKKVLGQRTSTRSPAAPDLLAPIMQVSIPQVPAPPAASLRESVSSTHRYLNHCWKCGNDIDSEVNARCPRCGMFVCGGCGTCMCR